MVLARIPRRSPVRARGGRKGKELTGRPRVAGREGRRVTVLAGWSKGVRRHAAGLAVAGPVTLAWAKAKAGRDGPPKVGAGAAGCWAASPRR